MTARLLADAVVVLHLLFIGFVGFGGLLGFVWRGAPWLHLPALLWGILIELTGWVCPLTPLENRLRRAGGEAGYPGGFIEHYVLPVIYPADLTRHTQILLAALLVCANVAIYFLLWRRARRRTAAD